MRTQVRFLVLVGLGSDVAVAMVRASCAAPTGPLAWELPYAKGVAPKRQKKKKKNRDRQRSLRLDTKT